VSNGDEEVLMDDDPNRVQRAQVERAEDWRGLTERVPFFQLPPGYAIAVIPPFHGAVARFHIRRPDGVVKSIYLDAFQRLGFWPDGGPYWEVYPVDGDVGRCHIYDTDMLLRYLEAPE
jgi:hypothetical protein